MDGKFTLATLGHKESKRQRVKETKRQRDKERKTKGPPF